MAYTRPAAGAVGPGGAKFGAGAGGSNRYNHTQWGGGLWSVGIDPNSPTLLGDLQAWYNAQPSNARAEVEKYWGKNKRTGNLQTDLANSIDWRQRDIARKVKIDNSFLNSTLGKILTTGATIVAGAINPALGAVVGGGVGAASGNPLNAIMGAIGGYGAGGVVDMFKGAGGFSTLMKAPGTFASNIGRDALTRLQNIVPGYGGNVASKIATGTGLVKAVAPTAASIINGAGTAAKTAASTYSARNLARDVLGVGVPIAATAALASQMNTKKVAAAQAAAPVQASPVEADVGGARQLAQKQALGAYGASDTVLAGVLGATGKARTRGKRVMGY